jgi:hypothetical protein
VLLPLPVIDFFAHLDWTRWLRRVAVAGSGTFLAVVAVPGLEQLAEAAKLARKLGPGASRGVWSQHRPPQAQLGWALFLLHWPSWGARLQ